MFERTGAELSDCEVFWELHVPRILAASRDTTIASLEAEALFRIDGPGGGEWALSVRRGVVEDVRRESLPSPTVTIRLREEVFLGIARGEIDHKIAFFTGRIKVGGDLPLVLRISSLIPVLRKAFPFEPDRFRDAVA